MGRLIGYARVSTTEQDLQLQIEALHRPPWLGRLFARFMSGGYPVRLASGSPRALDGPFSGGD